MPAHPDVTGHVALVSGANHGIGAATAHLLARHGAAVLITYLRTEVSGQYPEPYRARRRLDGEALAASIRSYGGQAQAVGTMRVHVDVVHLALVAIPVRKMSTPARNWSRSS
jgi:NAD(P)-dependent dehydrogenase (short-subunit alcohol dehydrogenase family)